MSSEWRAKIARLVDVVRENAHPLRKKALPRLKNYVEEVVISYAPTSQNSTAPALELRRSPAKLRKALEALHSELSMTAKSGRQLSSLEIESLLDRPAWDALMWLDHELWFVARVAVRAGVLEAEEALCRTINELRRAHGGRRKRTKYGWVLDAMVGHAGNVLDIAEGKRPRLSVSMNSRTRRRGYSRPGIGGDPYGPFIRVAKGFLQELCPDVEIRPNDIPHALERLFRTVHKTRKRGPQGHGQGDLPRA